MTKHVVFPLNGRKRSKVLNNFIGIFFFIVKLPAS